MKRRAFLLLAFVVLISCKKEKKETSLEPDQSPSYFGDYTGDLHFIGASYYRQDSLGNWSNNPYNYHINPGKVVVKEGNWDQSNLMLFVMNNNDSLVLLYDKEFKPDQNGVYHDTVPGGSGYRHFYIKFKDDSIIVDKYTAYGLGGGYGEVHVRCKK